MTVLVVDDEPTIPRLFDQRFRKEIREGLVSFLYASSGDKALELLVSRGREISLVLSDINMPGMSGLDFLDALATRGIKIPVYIVSAYDGGDFETLALGKGAAGFLAKPLRFSDLTNIFQSLSPPENP